MNKNDIVKIRNSAGILDIKLIEKLNNRDVFRGFDNRLNFSKNIRWEFHEKSGRYMITLCENNEMAKDMIIAFLEPCEELEIWLGEMLGTEKDENIYTLMGE